MILLVFWSEKERLTGNFVLGRGLNEVLKEEHCQEQQLLSNLSKGDIIIIKTWIGSIILVTAAFVGRMNKTQDLLTLAFHHAVMRRTHSHAVSRMMQQETMLAHRAP